MYETLLFLHVLSAFVLMAGLVIFSAAALGAPIGAPARWVGDRCTEIGATLVLIFGVWIVLREDAYDLVDGWILGAIGLWILATALGTIAGRSVPKGDDPRVEGSAAVMHWLSTAAVVGILVLMVWKPGL